MRKLMQILTIQYFVPPNTCWKWFQGNLQRNKSLPLKLWNVNVISQRDYTSLVYRLLVLDQSMYWHIYLLYFEIQINESNINYLTSEWIIKQCLTFQSVWLKSKQLDCSIGTRSNWKTNLSHTIKTSKCFSFTS